jgi:predicted dehydrogenase
MISNNNEPSIILLGAGNIGFSYDFEEESSSLKLQQTMTHTKALFERFNSNSILVVDVNKGVLETISKIYKYAVLQSISELRAGMHFKFAVIATPTVTHLDLVNLLIENHKVDKLLIEKPIGLNYKDCLAIHSLTDLHGVEVYVNYFRRYLSGTVLCKESISKFYLGKLLSFKIDAYGSLLNIFSHFIDLAMEITQSNLFCYCKKINSYKFGDVITFFCKACNVEYEFTGINYTQKNCSVYLKFENYEIEILQNGKVFKIIEKSTFNSLEFKSSDDEYKNYQRHVFEAIFSTKFSRYDFSGLNQSLKVHQLIESFA